ncbi:flagellar biosynthetic protein FliO [Sanguibacter antarcticus]|uniref:Flagellar biosynthesis protein FliO n=1 Tax=Sanguibacter antarcticus TaxID=372484 RepID=A0A2A9E0T3_9MICO|nr:flagellar biosynthetic protein FliO [Sanguibacter antarcticus]PFG32246.1 flagellar biosynthesis protein FliO [Sanguibacter antarcticus]
MDTAVLVLRTVLSLTAVLGLIWYAGRKLNDSANGQGGDGFLARLVGGAGGTRRAGRRGQHPAVVVTVVARQVLGSKASLAVVDVGDQRLVLGVTESGVNVLSTQEIPPAEETADDLVAVKAEVREEISLTKVAATATNVTSIVTPLTTPHQPALAAVRTASAGPLGSSILSPTTWRQTLSLMQGRTVRR